MSTIKHPDKMIDKLHYIWYDIFYHIGRLLHQPKRQIVHFVMYAAQKSHHEYTGNCSKL